MSVKGKLHQKKNKQKKQKKQKKTATKNPTALKDVEGEANATACSFPLKSFLSHISRRCLEITILYFLRSILKTYLLQVMTG